MAGQAPGSHADTTVTTTSRALGDALRSDPPRTDSSTSRPPQSNSSLPLPAPSVPVTTTTAGQVGDHDDDIGDDARTMTAAQDEPTVLDRVKRIPQLVKAHIPFVQKQRRYQPKLVWSVEPPSFVPSAAGTALKDTLYSAPSQYGPSLESLSPFSFTRRVFRSHPASPAESDDSDVDSPPPSPPSDEVTEPTLRTESSTPPMSRSSSRQVSALWNNLHSHSRDPLAVHGSVVMLGGYRGSVLRDVATGRRMWLTTKHYRGTRQMDLGLRLSDEAEENSEATIKATKMMTQFKVVDMGHRLKTKFLTISKDQKTSTSTHFLPFLPTPSAPADLTRPPLELDTWGYDFRRRPELASRDLIRHLTALKEKSAERGEGPDGRGLGTVVVCHSMGGLVTLHALATCPDPTIFRGIVFAGSPFQGTANILGPLKLDQEFKKNRGVGSPEVVFSWRSSFYFLPRGPYFGADPAAHFASVPLPSPPLTADSRTSSNANVSPPPTPSSESLPKGAFDHHYQSHTPPPLEALIHGCFEDPAGNPIPVDFFDPETWSSHALSPMTAGLYGPLLNGEVVDWKEKQKERKSRKNLGSKSDSMFPFPGAPATMGEGSGSVNHMFGKAVEQGNEVAEQIDGVVDGNDDDGTVPLAIEEDYRSPEVIDRYLRSTLERVSKFYEDIEQGFDPAKQLLYPPVALLAGRSHPTVRGVLVENRHQIPQGMYEARLYGNGDGIVMWESATNLPGRWGEIVQGTSESKHGHIALLSDFSAVRKAFDLLNLAV